jgi:hypothetical protein
MEIVAVIATVLLLATLLTLIFSFAAYFVTRAKKLLASKRATDDIHRVQNPQDRIYFERYTLRNSEEQDKTSPHDRDSQWM